MRVLLPPSETKRSGGVGVFAPEVLAFQTPLGSARARVRKALEALCADEVAALRALKLGAKNRGELTHNLVLASSGVMPAIERYTGVLYDALDVTTLDTTARDWIDEHVLVQSALFGLIPAGDAIPAYRLSAATRLPGLHAPLKPVWREAHQEIDWAAFGWILDLRSKDYVALAPLPAGVGTFLHVAQRDDTSAVRALNHFNKAAKGFLVRRLAESGADLADPDDFFLWASSVGFELAGDPITGEITLVLPKRDAGAPPGAVLESLRAV